jgi:hypothetical protein
LTAVLLAGFGTDRLRREEAMKTARRRTPKLPGSPARQPSTWRGRSEQILLNQLGCEARKIAAMGEIFFLTSTCSENCHQAAALLSSVTAPKIVIKRLRYFRV